MLQRIADEPWLAWLLETVHVTQKAVLQFLARFGWVEPVDGQPAWPWPWRVSGDNLLIDAAQARQFVLLLVAVTLAVLLVAIDVIRRGKRPWFSLLGLGLVLCVPWPSASVILTKAYPTSFHEPTVAFSDQAIAQGAQVYANRCVHCHDEQGSGWGPQAASLPAWPPNFASPLLWRRSDGDLLWAILHGVRDASGRTTMPGFSEDLSTEDAWNVLHYLRALGAGQLLKLTGKWAQPIRLPELDLRCNKGDTKRSTEWRGQYVRLVSGPAENLRPDPRLVTLWLPEAGDAGSPVPMGADCIVESAAQARRAIALVTGVDDIAAVQLLTDRQGWLRALNDRGAGAWSDDDLLCRAPDGQGALKRAAGPGVDGAAGIAAAVAAPGPGRGDALDRILRAMDAEPVRFVKGGRVH